MKKLLWTAGITAVVAGFAVPSPASSDPYCGEVSCFTEEDCWEIIRDCDTCPSQSPIEPAICQLT